MPLQPLDLIDEMALAPHQLVRVTHSADFQEWGIRTAEKDAVVRLGAPLSAQPAGRIYGDHAARIDPAYPVSVQVLDPLQRGGNNHIAARRRLAKTMADAGFAEVKFFEAEHFMHILMATEGCAVDPDEWLASVPEVEPDFVIDESFDEGTSRNLGSVQLPPISVTQNPTPPSSDRLEEFEAHWKLRLPDDYFAFLLQYNGGVPRSWRIAFSTEGESRELTIVHFLSIFPADQFSPMQMPFDLEAAFETQLSMLPEGLIPVAVCLVDHEPCHLCLEIAGDVRGRVVLFQRYLSERNCTDVASSFSEFLGQLAD